MPCLSHPAWVCGLKLQCPYQPIRKRRSHPAWVCGLKPKIGKDIGAVPVLSHPAWVCGLKQWYPMPQPCSHCHTLRGCVDWNFYQYPQYKHITGHTLRGCVDWNINGICSLSYVSVTPCVGVYGLKHCSLVGQVYGRIVSIRPLVYFSSSCYKVKSQTKYVRLLTLLWLEKTRTIPDAYLLSVFFCGFT